MPRARKRQVGQANYSADDMTRHTLPSQTDGNRAKKTKMVDTMLERLKDDLAEMFGYVDSLTDPQAQIVRFFRAVDDGMKPVRAAHYFLHLDELEYAQFIQDNPQTAFLISNFEGRVYQSQVKKITKDGAPADALKWLAAHDPEVWTPRTKSEATGKDGGPLDMVIRVEYADVDSNAPETAPSAADDQERVEEV